MQRFCFASLTYAISVAALATALSGGCSAQTEKILYNFTGGSDGGYPNGSLIFDSKGILYGVTSGGGTNPYCQCGTVFKLSPGSNGVWSESVLYSFGASNGGADGIGPAGPLVFDAKGNLYGTASAGGANSFNGVVFELTPGSNGVWTESVIYSFTGGSDGRNPSSGVIFDSVGNLYGVAGGGASGFGVVFELVAGTNGTWTQKVLHTFKGGNDGSYATGSLVFDKSGSLYGVAIDGGAHDYGLIYKLSPGSTGTWTEKVLYAFPGGAGGNAPLGGLVWDSANNLYGVATSYVAFELSLNATGTWTEKTLHRFTGGTDGADPQSLLTFDKAGNLYGTTYTGGAHRGTVYELSPTASGPWTETILHRFSSTGGDGINPDFPVVIDAAGDLYSTTLSGGSFHYGTVFEIVP